MTSVARSSSEDQPPDLRTASFRSPKVIAAGLLAAGAPLSLLLANTDWFFTREGYLDPWNYVGLFHQYRDADYLPEDYKLARLPWILAGFVATRLFSSVTAAYVLHAAFLAAASLGLFMGINALLRRPALAAVVAMGFGFYTHAHGSGGWDYHNTGAGAFYLATFALLALPQTINGHRGWLLGAGVMAALAVHTNITLANFLPVLAFVHVCSLSIRSGSLPGLAALIGRAGWALLGAGLITALLGLVNWMVGREFVFFGILLNIVLRYVSDPSHQEAFHQPWSSGWWLTARYLALPGAVFLAGTVSMLSGRGRIAQPPDRLAHALIGQFLAMTLAWVAWQTAGQTALDVDYFAYVLIPSCFVALGGILYRGWPAWCERHWLATILCTALVLTVSLTVEQVPEARRVAALVGPAIVVAGCLLFLFPLAVYRWRPSVVSAAILVVTFAFGNRLVAPGYPDYFASDPCKVQPGVYGAIVDAASWLMQIDPLYNRASTWFDENELLRPANACTVRLGHMANSITTMASVPYVTRAFPMPGVEDVPDESVAALTEDRLLVIISNEPGHLDDWRRRLGAMGLAHKEVAFHRVPVLASGFTMHAWSVGPESR